MTSLEGYNLVVFYHLCGCDRMVVGFTTIYAIGAYHYWCCEFESWSGRGVQHYVIKFGSDLPQVGGLLRVILFSPPIDCHNITEILLNVAINTIKQTNKPSLCFENLTLYLCILFLGGKWTTYRHMAEETVDKAIKICNLKPTSSCRTKGLMLDGGHGWSPTLFIRLVQDFGLENEVFVDILYRKPRLLFSSKSWKLENEVFVDIFYLKPIFLFLIKIMKTHSYWLIS